MIRTHNFNCLSPINGVSFLFYRYVTNRFHSRDFTQPEIIGWNLGSQRTTIIIPKKEREFLRLAEDQAVSFP